MNSLEHAHTPKALLWEKWLNLLRSGTYQQGNMRLKNINRDGTVTYCCLGVAAEGVLGRQFVPSPRKMENFRAVYISPDGVGEQGSMDGICSTNLSDSDNQVLGLDKELTEKDREILKARVGDESMSNTNRTAVCMWFNDAIRLSFVEMADILDELGWANDDDDADQD